MDIFINFVECYEHLVSKSLESLEKTIKIDFVNIKILKNICCESIRFGNVKLDFSQLVLRARARLHTIPITTSLHLTDYRVTKLNSWLNTAEATL